MTNQSIAIFGAGGFIGSNLAHHLRGHERYGCTLLDVDERKLRLRFGNGEYRYVSCDISKPDAPIAEIVAEHDIVVHLAAHVHPQAFLDRPLDVVQLNFFDALKVVDACVAHGKRLIHFSTSEVYGKTGGSDAAFKEDESDCILGPVANHRWIYSNAKQLLDRIIHAHGLKGDLDYTLIRPFNFVGPLMDKLLHDPDGDDNPRVLAHFLSALFYGRPLQLVNGGHSRRCFTYIGDAIAALELVLDSPEALRNQIVNVGNPSNETTIRDLAALVLEIYRRDFDPEADNPLVEVPGEVFYGAGYEDCDRRLPDISKLTALGWQPQVGLEETFARSMRYFHDNREALEATL